jgi:aminopeptidase N
MLVTPPPTHEQEKLRVTRSRPAILATLFALALAVGGGVVAPVRPASAAGIARAAAGRDQPALSPDEVLRLIEESQGVGADRKRPPAAGFESARPTAVEAESTHAYDVTHYDLAVTLRRQDRLVTGGVTVHLTLEQPGQQYVALDAVAMAFSNVTVNGVPRTGFIAAPETLYVPICEGADCPPHGVGDTLSVHVDYGTYPSTGFFNYARNAYSFVEPDEAKYWWPCYDQPSDKATLDLYGTVPDSNSCWSNGVLVDVTPAAAMPGFSTWHWRETHPVATYLVSVAVANFWKWTQMAGSIPIIDVTFPEDSTKAKADYLNVPTMVTTFSNLWVPYPFDKYGQTMVDPFGPGGMEHQTMTTLRRQLLRGDRTYEYVWAHELAHQWWGDWVTCVDFRDIWLNEGFASYAEAEWEGRFYGQAKYDSTIAGHMADALAADASFRYAIYDPPTAYTFGTTIYHKGSAVLHMLRRIIGDTAFYEGLQLYGTRNAYGNGTTRDVQHAMEDAWGQPLDWFFDEWVFAAGIPTYTWWWRGDAVYGAPSPGQTDVTLFVQQTQASAPLYKMPITFRITRSAMPDTIVTVANDAVSAQAFLVRVNGVATGAVIDPFNSILKRVVNGTVSAGMPPGMLTGAHLALRVTPNPAHGGPVSLNGAWVARDGLPALAGPARVRFRLYDATGRLVRDFGDVHAVGVNGATGAGGSPYVVIWNGTDRAGRRVRAGLYFAEIVAGQARDTRPLGYVP